MKTSVKGLFVQGVLICLTLSLAGQTVTSREIKIVSTIFPLAEMAREVVGERGEVFQLIPSGIEVHDFQLRPSDVVRLRQADLILAVGAGLEPWLKKIESVLDNKHIQKIYFHDELKKRNYPGLDDEDPHLWLDLKADELLVGALVEALVKIDAAGEKYYLERGFRLQRQLAALDREFQEQLKSCRSDVFIVAGHQAFGYLARRYNLKLYSLVGANPEARPGLKKLQEIVEIIKKERVRAIFYESSVNPYYAESIARETGVILYPLSTGVNLKVQDIEKNVSFLKLMEQNLNILKTALECQGKERE